jgi:O-antigen/teichoic acid export membrane protein
MDEEQIRIAGKGGRIHLTASSLLGKVVTFVAGAILLIAAFAMSLLVLAVAATVGLLVGGYLWWKTRELRRRFREQPAATGGRVIDGEVIREDDPGERR